MHVQLASGPGRALTPWLNLTYKPSHASTPMGGALLLPFRLCCCVKTLPTDCQNDGTEFR